MSPLKMTENYVLNLKSGIKFEKPIIHAVQF